MVNCLVVVYVACLLYTMLLTLTGSAHTALGEEPYTSGNYTNTRGNYINTSGNHGSRVRVRRAYGRNGSQWTKVNGELVIPYVILFPTNSWQYKRIMKAIYDVNRVIRCNRDAWRPRRGERSYVIFQKSRTYSCNSNVGRVSLYAPQAINLPDWCTASPAIYHEMMHAMGFWHELDRPDRHNYISLKLHNVKRGRLKKFKSMKSDNPFGPFGYRSIMMVHDRAYSKDRARGLRTIVAHDWRNQKKMRDMIVRRRGLSNLDVKMLNRFYDCDGGKNYVADNWVQRGGCGEWDWCRVAVRNQKHSCQLRRWKRACSISCGACNPRRKEKASERRVARAKSTYWNRLTLRTVFYVVFHNRHVRRVNLIWKDYAGREILYRFVDPGVRVAQVTYNTHPWIARDTKSNTLLRFVRRNNNDVIFEGRAYGVRRMWEIVTVAIVTR